MKNKIVACLLAIFLGGLGAHKFYFGKWFQGFIYLIFSWTGIPAIVALIEGIYYFFMNDDDFQEKYGGVDKSHQSSSTYSTGNNMKSTIGSRLINK